ncbi:uncharacterized protein LOC116291293 [Actinia tenebrosa]|uniref:Uncharacterized protein LOC116291293 n=1 Tax=Actinia tenebrosa TaxID=6105 RepID=A0A6P8HEZ0_ACTTE|nr:uncharacterized protein LOC116291293 [Actinia tenebrosa]
MVPRSNHLIADDVRGLVFDCDGTLLDTMPLHWRAWCSVCKDTGLNFTKEDFYVLAGVPGKKIISVLALQQGKILDAQEVYEKKKNYFLSELSSVGPIACVLKYVYEANQRGIPVAVASGSSKKQVEQALTNARIRDFFDFVLGNEDYAHHKPNPEVYLKAAEQLGLEPSQCWGFEDTDIGLESIERAGYAKAIDVRLLPEYPEKRPTLNNDSTAPSSRRLRRALTVG